MKNLKSILVLCLCVILMAAFGTVLAQDETAPAFRVSEVVPDTTVTVITKNIPADTSYLVSLGNIGDPDSVTAVAKFNSKNGGALSVTVKIPEKYRGQEALDIILTDSNGGKIEGSFENIATAVEPTAESVVEEEEAAEEPAAEEEEAADESAAAEEELVDESAAAEEEVVEEESAAAEEEVVEEESAASEEEEVVDESAAAEEEVVDESAAAEEEAAAEESVSLVNDSAALEEQPVEDESSAYEEEAAEESAAAEEEVVEEETVAADDILVSAETTCDYSVTPYVYIDSVVKDGTVTFTTYNFPANSTFSVQMGVFNGTNPGRPQHHEPDPRHNPENDPQPGYDPEPRPEPKPQPIPDGNQGVVALTQIFYDLEQPAPSFNDHHDHGPKPAPVASVPTFSGQEVGKYETGDGSSQTLTFDIPEDLQGTGTIALWIADEGSCGFYAYNYFYNY